jgi:hypothetical protein
MLTRPGRELECFNLKCVSEGGTGVHGWGYQVDLGPKKRWAARVLPETVYGTPGLDR